MSGVKTVYPSTLQVRLISKLGKSGGFDNKNFHIFCIHKLIKLNHLQTINALDAR